MAYIQVAMVYSLVHFLSSSFFVTRRDHLQGFVLRTFVFANPFKMAFTQHVGPHISERVNQSARHITWADL